MKMMAGEDAAALSCGIFYGQNAGLSPCFIHCLRSFVIAIRVAKAYNLSKGRCLFDISGI